METPSTPTASSWNGGVWSPSLALTAATSHARLARWRRHLPQVAALEEELKALPDDELRKRSLSVRYRARSGERLEQLLSEAYALVREAARRTVDMRHFDVQILGGIALFHGSIAEMETGEGKTLVATLPLYLRSLAGKGAHLATVNDYLARRDAEWMGPIYKLLGLTVGVIQTGMNQEQRRRAYASDITYGTAKEFGFDFLRDRLLLRRLREEPAASDGASPLSGGKGAGEQTVHRTMHFAIVDEADSILIDEARTPLIISAVPGEAQYRAVACYEWAAANANQFVEDQHYEYDLEKKKAELTLAGRHLARKLPKPDSLGPVGLIDIYTYLERAIKVGREFHRDREFVVRNGEVVIVDEYTGRLAEGRKWSGGIHQAVEAKEGEKVTVESGHAARITVQDLFKRYQHLAGMTGTAATSARELKKIYGTPVVRIPTNRPTRRYILPDRVFSTSQAKWEAIVEQIRELHQIGRPVLVGTRSIDKSEHLSGLLTQAGIPHQVLNARHIAKEAEIVSQAGQPGRVTVATNMAGRGTDIKLGDGIAQLGGLHVICTEMHDAARIDRQLAGRCGRQGDPGTAQQYLAVDDDILLMAYGTRRAEQLRQAGATGNDLHHLARQFRKAQRVVERRYFRSRRILLYHEKYRKKMHVEMGQDPYLDMPDQ
jgi:preprotein translocase subunit SecA